MDLNPGGQEGLRAVIAALVMTASVSAFPPRQSDETESGRRFAQGANGGVGVPNPSCYRK